jgi:hypothetical protein
MLDGVRGSLAVFIALARISFKSLTVCCRFSAVVSQNGISVFNAFDAGNFIHSALTEKYS